MRARVTMLPTAAGGRLTRIRSSAGRHYIPHVVVDNGEYLGVRVALTGPDLLPGETTELILEPLYQSWSTTPRSALEPASRSAKGPRLWATVSSWRADCLIYPRSALGGRCRYPALAPSRNRSGPLSPSGDASAHKRSMGIVTRVPSAQASERVDDVDPVPDGLNEARRHELDSRSIEWTNHHTMQRSNQIEI